MGFASIENFIDYVHTELSLVSSRFVTLASTGPCLSKSDMSSPGGKFQSKGIYSTVMYGRYFTGGNFSTAYRSYFHVMYVIQRSKV